MRRKEEERREGNKSESENVELNLTRRREEQRRNFSFLVSNAAAAYFYRRGALTDFWHTKWEEKFFGLHHTEASVVVVVAAFLFSPFLSG